MKRRIYLAILLAITSLTLLPLGALAQSVTLTPDQVTAVASACVDIKDVLIQVEKSDVVARINRGRDYDQMLTQIDAFNTRLANNKVAQPQLLQLASELHAAVAEFREDYDAYSTQLTNAEQANCAAKPADYYSAIVQTRTLRASLGDEVKAIDVLMAQYRSAVVQYQGTIEQTAPPTSSQGWQQ